MSTVDMLGPLWKLIAIVAVAFFLGVTALAQYTYWTKNEKRDIPHMTRKYKMLYRIGFYEGWTFAGIGALYLIVALCRGLWWLVTKGW